MIDSSALIAILTKEPDWFEFFQVLAKARRPIMGAPNWVESCVVFDNRANANAARELDVIVRRMRIEVVPFDATMAEVARSAHQRYGRGSKHPARLNYGDCMAYALAKQTGEPLLFKGDDFPQTDITPARA